MTRILGWLAIGGVVVACNNIVGVEDVRLRGSGSKPSTANNGNGNGDGSGNTDPGDGSGTGTGTGGGTRDAGPSAGCGGAAACQRYVFITSATFTGKLNGLAGADAACLNAARGSKIPLISGRAFHAWLSDSSTDASAASRTVHGTQAYLRTDGSVFATGFSDMTDGSVAHSLNIDESGNNLTGGSLSLEVWTSSSSVGAYNLQGNCQNWTSDAVTDNGAFGDAQAVDGTWTEVENSDTNDPATATCNSPMHLYCIEY